MIQSVSCEWLGRKLTLETGQLAKQTNGSVVVRYGETIVLVTAVAEPEAKENIDFLPLTVDFQEKFYSAGKIPGGYIKREGRPSSYSILYSRLIDRPLRPAFPKNYFKGTHIVATTLSVDNESHPAILALIGASAALEISDIPFNGPIAGVRVGRINGEYRCNPSLEEMEKSDLDILVAGNNEGVIMVEGDALVVPDQAILEGIFFGLQQLKPILDLQQELKQKVGKEKMTIVPLEVSQDLQKKVEQEVWPQIKKALQIKGKQERADALKTIQEALAEKFAGEKEEKEKEKINFQVKSVLDQFWKKAMRGMILEEKKRVDGRGWDDVRPIDCAIGFLPRTHGSGIFTRGETQALATVTLGTADDEQMVDSIIEGESSQAFMLHYNFPPFSVGEASFLRGPGRREVGHGALAEKALASVIPSKDQFPYTVRIVSEVLESNGSSSMATVCSGSLALMDAGVPVKAHVSGVAMGLIKEGKDYAILTDILGDEDHCGDMDFKVTGTREGVTAFQMDVKVSELSPEILNEALAKAKKARLGILDKMEEIISQPKKEMSPYAPKIVALDVKADKIGAVIGPGGKVIRGIIEKTGVQIDIDDKAGKINIFSPDKASLDKAVAIVQGLIEEPEIGKTYHGKVKKIVDFGAFVEVLPNVDGLLHISEIDFKRIERVSDVLQEGEEVLVKIIDIDNQGRIRLSRKAVLRDSEK